MKRWAILLAAIGLGVWTAAGCAPAGEQGQGGLAATADEAAAKDLEVQRKLQRRLQEVTLVDQTLAQCMEWIAMPTGLNIQVKWAAVHSSGGIEPQTAVNELRLKDVTAERALRAILDHVSTPSTQLGYTVFGGVVIISTREEVSGSQYRTTAIYDIRDLIPPAVPGAVSPPEPVASQQFYPEPHSTRSDAIKDLCNTVARMVDRESWQDPLGTGTVGAMEFYGGLLIVQQTWANQQKIAALLADIRRHKPTFK